MFVAAEQGLPFSLLVTLSYHPVAPRPARGIIRSVSKSTQHNLSTASLDKNREVKLYCTNLTLRAICCIFFHTYNLSAIVFPSGDYGHNVMQHSCFARYSCAHSAYTCTSFIWVALLYSAAVTGGGYAGHFDITEHNQLICNIIVPMLRDYWCHSLIWCR